METPPSKEEMEIPETNRFSISTKKEGLDSDQTPDSAGRPKSTASGDIVFESKRKKKRYTPSLPGDEGHDVTITVNIAMAVPTAFDDAENDDQPDLKDMLKKRLIEAPRAQNYYHLEYRLLPPPDPSPTPSNTQVPAGTGAGSAGDDELSKTDVVTYGVACKVYMEKHDARVVKTWQNGDVTWFSWAHSHTITVTKETLLRMFKHTVELRVWDTKDKCSTRARFDRPKAFRLPQPKPGEKPEDIGGVKAMVTKQMKHYIDQRPRGGVPIRQLPSEISVPHFMDNRKQSMSAMDGRRSGRISSSAASKVLVAVPNKDAKDGKTFDRLGQLAGAQRLEERSSPRSKKSGKTTNSGSSPSKSPQGQSSGRMHSTDPGDRKSSNKDDRELRKQLAEKAKANAEYIKKNGICMIPLRLALLFGDKKNITSRLQDPLAGIEDIFFSVTVNTPLLSDMQKEDLNPMMIQVKNATSLPAAPLSFADLRLRCHPVYCKYKFFQEPEHTTPGKEHDRNIYWEDTSVALLGTMEPSELREYLNGPGMQIEVHDRDRKPEQVALKPMLFGDDLEDEKIANVGTVESRRTTHNPFKGRDKPWDPYGQVQVDLSELLLGHRFMEIKLPIQSCPMPDLLGHSTVGQQGETRLVGVAGAVDGPVDRPLSAGQYVHDTAMLKLKIELAHPLTTPSKLAAKEYITTSKECPFNRIIFMFGYSNTELLNNLQTLIMGINARALGLDAMAQHVIDAALSTYKLSVVQQCSLDLDIVTGFHILDGQRHLFVLEGLRDKAINLLWDALPKPDNSDVFVLYNSDFAFSRRLYGPLDVDLCRVKLHEPLAVIVRQSLLYIRDMVFRPCFDALMRLDQITRTLKMKDVVRNDLFPSTEMIVCVSREFGVPFTQKDFEELQCKPETQGRELTEATEGSHDAGVTMTRPYQPEPSRNWTPIDNFNQDYMDVLKKGKERQNYVQENIAQVHAKSEESRAERARTRKPRIYADVGDTCHNYSTQGLNSMELAREKLRNYLNNLDPDGRYAFNQEFMSAMFCPVNLKQEEKDLAAAEKDKWRTSEGWIYPGVRPTKESNEHPRRPDPARLDELKEDWIENILHSNIFNSPLARGPYPWPERHVDMDLYVKPPPSFGNKDPLSIQSTGVQKEAERIEVKRKQLEDWKSRIVVEDTEQHFHRVLPATEMIDRGRYASNQIEKLKGLLKDEPKKLGLQLEEPSPNNMPALGVVNDPSLDTTARALGMDLQPAIPNSMVAPFKGFKPGMFVHSWSHNNNHVPCYDYNHDLFKGVKGRDFNVYHKNRNKLNLRPIVSLSQDERDNHLFRIPVFSASRYPRPLPQVGQRSHTAQARMVGDHNSGHAEQLTSEMKPALGLQSTDVGEHDLSRKNGDHNDIPASMGFNNAVDTTQAQAIPVGA